MAVSPPRVTLGSIDTGVTLSCQYNPDHLEEDLGVAYHKIKIQGLSHVVLQYEHTENWTAKFDLTFDSLSVGLQRGVSDDPHQARTTLQSWCYPKKGAGSIAANSPTRVLFVWPKMIALQGVITKLSFKHKRFAWGGVDPTKGAVADKVNESGQIKLGGSLVSTWFVVTVSLEEIRDTRLFASDVQDLGTRRSP